MSEVSSTIFKRLEASLPTAKLLRYAGYHLPVAGVASREYKADQRPFSIVQFHC
ncbi:hypothetical protein CSC17_0263 [Klebsiella oxytoca]|nr:hypothetical protein CSC17_0263 [Klebsiella oxytoca]